MELPLGDVEGLDDGIHIDQWHMLIIVNVHMGHALFDMSPKSITNAFIMCTL